MELSKSTAQGVVFDLSCKSPSDRVLCSFNTTLIAYLLNGRFLDVIETKSEMGSYPRIARGRSAGLLEEVAQDNLRFWIGRQVPACKDAIGKALFPQPLCMAALGLVLGSRLS